MLEICSDLPKTALKYTFFVNIQKRQKKWPNGQTILFLANSFKKGQICQIWPLKRPNGNPEINCHGNLSPNWILIYLAFSFSWQTEIIKGAFINDVSSFFSVKILNLFFTINPPTKQNHKQVCMVNINEKVNSFCQFFLTI